MKIRRRPKLEFDPTRWLVSNFPDRVERDGLPVIFGTIELTEAGYAWRVWISQEGSPSGPSLSGCAPKLAAAKRATRKAAGGLSPPVRHEPKDPLTRA